MNDLMTKSFLSYVELKKQAIKDLEMGPDHEIQGLSASDEENLGHFFEEVGAAKVDMEEISTLLVDLQYLNEETKSAHSARVLRGLRDRMDSDMVTILRKAKTIKARLEALDKSNITNRDILSGYKEGSPVDRTRISVTNGLRIKLREMMNGFQSLREGIVMEHKEGLKRRYFNATGEEASEELVEKMVKMGEQMEVSEKEVKLNLENDEREVAAKAIQRSLMELHQVFLDMAIMVEAQGEHLNDIEENVVRGREYISGGTNRLVSATDTKKKNRKLAIWLWSFVLILILVCIVSIISSS